MKSKAIAALALLAPVAFLAITQNTPTSNVELSASGEPFKQAAVSPQAHAAALSVLTSGSHVAAGATKADVKVCSHTQCEISNGHTVVHDWQRHESQGEKHHCISNFATGTCVCLCGTASKMGCSSKILHDVTGQNKMFKITNSHELCTDAAVDPVNKHDNGPTECTVGHFLLNHECKICPAGHHCDGAKQTPCQAGKSAVARQSVCTDCAAGTWSAHTAPSCTNCGSDSKYSAAGKADGCDTCATGSFTAGGNANTRTTCTVCPSGYTCDGTSVRTKCVSTDQVPKYVNNNQCVACPKGHTCDGAVATACVSSNQAPKYVNNNKCAACPRGHTCDGAVATACARTKYVHLNVCTACPNGHECNGAEKTACGPDEFSTGGVPCKTIPCSYRGCSNCNCYVGANNGKWNRSGPVTWWSKYSLPRKPQNVYVTKTVNVEAFGEAGVLVLEGDGVVQLKPTAAFALGGN